MFYNPTFTAQAVIAAATRAKLEIRQYVAIPDDSPMELEGYLTIQHKAEPTRRYLVILPGANHAYPEGKCTCPAWQKANGVCKHVYVALELAAEEAMLADLYEREEAREFMLETSREHNVGFSAEVYDDTAATWPTCDLHGAYDAAANGSPMSTCDRCEEFRF